MLHRLQAGSAGKMAKYGMWYSVRKCPFLGAASACDIQSSLAFLFKRREKLAVKVACLGFFVRSLVNKKMVILRFGFAERRLDLLRVLHHSQRESENHFLIYRNYRNIPGSCSYGEEREFGPISALQPVYFFSPGALEMLLGNEKGKRSIASINVRNGTWWPGFARAASRPT